MKTRAAVLVGFLLISAASPARAGGDTIFMVTNSLDSGIGSLRDAVSNALKIVTGDNVLVYFQIPTGGVVHTINLLSQLPIITNTMQIDGRTQTGYSNTPLIKLVSAGPGVNIGIHLRSSACSVRGLCMTAFSNRAIEISIQGNSTIAGCHIVSNYGGIVINNVGNNTIGGNSTNDANVIGANSYIGLNISGAGANNNYVSANYIGVQPVGGGLSVLSNDLSGIYIFAGSSNIIRGSASARQIISGNAQDGISIWGPTHGNRVEGNYIGVDLAGSAAIPNQWGILVAGSDNIIGGTAVSNRNIISGNSIGVYLSGSEATDNQIAGNYICVNAAGTAAVPGSGGIFIQNCSNNVVSGTATAPQIIAGSQGAAVFVLGPDADGNVMVGNTIGIGSAGLVITNNNNITLVNADNNRIGGPAAADRNIIAGSQISGVDISDTSSNNVVQGNLIGLDAGGVARPNNAYGVSIGDGTGNLIGGDEPGERNIISGNRLGGVYISAVSNRVQGNYIGTGIPGATALPNGAHGVIIDSGMYNLIGGTNGSEGNVISGNATNGIYITGASAEHNTIAANFIGTTASGAVGLSNRNSGIVFQNAKNNVVGGLTPGERNIISGNANNGIEINGVNTATGIVVIGNFIGMASNGVSQLGNGLGGGFGAGVFLNVLVRGNTIGGAAPAARNIIGANTRGFVMQGAHNNLIQGNYIGLDVTGAAAASNRMDGIHLEGSTSNRIANNVISCSENSGIYMFSGGTSNVVEDNYIGTDAAGAAARGNRDDGIRIESSSGNLVANNVITANRHDGIDILGGGSSNVVRGNRVGLWATGNSGPGNLIRGILINGGDANQIGGTNAAHGNIIAYNTDDGIAVFTNLIAGGGFRNSILGNLIYSNGFPIDLSDNGVTANDPAPDADAGPNNYQNFPVISSATQGSTIVRGMLISGASQTYRCEFFAIGVPQGAVFLGATNITTPPSGTNAFVVTLPGTASTGAFVIATATDTNGNTSEFSPASVTIKAGSDSDGDGLWDTWEVQHFGNLAQTGTGDNDADGRNNYYEFVSDTQPTNAGSFFRLASITNGLPRYPGWVSSAARWYDVETSTNLLAPTWVTLSANIVGAGGIQSLADAADVTSRAYRVRAKVP